MRRYLPAGATVLLVSGMDEATVRQTYATYSPDLGAALARARELVGKADPSVLVLPDAGDSVPRAGWATFRVRHDPLHVQ